MKTFDAKISLFNVEAASNQDMTAFMNYMFRLWFEDENVEVHVDVSESKPRLAE